MKHRHHGTHGHDHDTGSHTHNGSPTEPLSGIEKLRRMIEHWIDHNVEHARSYNQWAEKADALGQVEAAELIRQAALETEALNTQFERVLNALR